jgi:hypothetical protein
LLAGGYKKLDLDPDPDMQINSDPLHDPAYYSTEFLIYSDDSVTYLKGAVQRDFNSVF